MNLADLQKKKYLENLKALSSFKKEKSAAYIFLISTFASMTFLILFAIGPTIGTITELQKKLEDSRMADAALDEKIRNMNTLRQQYNQLSPDLLLITAALPQEPIPTDLLGRLQAAATSHNVRILTLTSSKVPLAGVPEENNGASDSSFGFSVIVSGSYANILNFFRTISHFDRLITVTSFSISRNQEEGSSAQERLFTIEGKAYYLK
jgi:Tfp pilus assembly protein PilO